MLSNIFTFDFTTAADPDVFLLNNSKLYVYYELIYYIKLEKRVKSIQSGNFLDIRRCFISANEKTRYPSLNYTHAVTFSFFFLNHKFIV